MRRVTAAVVIGGALLLAGCSSSASSSSASSGTTANSDANTARTVTIAEDRDNPGTYFNIVHFDSYQSAMKNSQRPEVGQFAEAMQKICDGPPKFYNLDVRMTR